MTVKLLTEHLLEFLSVKGGCTGSSESTLVKIPQITCHGSILSDLLEVFYVPHSSPINIQLTFRIPVISIYLQADNWKMVYPDQLATRVHTGKFV